MAAPQYQEIFDLMRLGNFDYRSPQIWSDDNHRRRIMAALVEAVYTMSESTDTSRKCWETFYYEMEHLLKDYKGRVFGAVFKSVLKEISDAPLKVMAFKGTTLNRGDIKADCQILLHRLAKHDHYIEALKVVRREVVCHGASCVCLTGHSKGASLALLVGRKLAEERCLLETHLFNPPFPTLPIELLPVSKEVKLVAHMVHDIAALVTSRSLLSAKERKRERAAFHVIRPWLPHLYVNVRDPICSSYVGYFQATRYLQNLMGESFGFHQSSTPHSIAAVLYSYVNLSGSKPDHLIPSAYLHVNHIAESKDVAAAHYLSQWWDVDMQLLKPLKLRFHASKDCMIKYDEGEGEDDHDDAINDDDDD